ncbi:class I SAM-dependent methyltransferase [Streptomyces tropicalis]|uniref:Class I SAM-dependent methyltransferase n=1 Tax=Streptomyces tropicalis TaxID=3034234 RepID=A0ABT6ABN2_9ACTN|nr:class I SAM-dependent methyltransferase [Streptomyces tropicalis]MDF3302067.1 class I SAM-dependent methyltransferase [Streptomyces tropicalis]
MTNTTASTGSAHREGSAPTGPGPHDASGPGAHPGGGGRDPLPAGPQPVPAAADEAPADVIPGAGPSVRPGERATLRLREDGPDEPPRYAPEWLQLREVADAAARAPELVDVLRTRLAGFPGAPGSHGGTVVHDLGCGTGSMGRWLAPRLDGAQHWILHDRDPYLLHFAAVGSPRAAADGSRVSVETRRADVARLTPDALDGASLVTASALLDVLTREEIDTLAAACAAAGCPALLTLSVLGRVELTPADPLDAEITEAFNAHQCRDGLLGPGALAAAGEAFARHGAAVRLEPSPWRLGPDQRELTAQWLRGWVGAAVEQRPELRARADRYLTERLAACAAGELEIVVHHSDLLALPGPAGGAA